MGTSDFVVLPDGWKELPGFPEGTSFDFIQHDDPYLTPAQQSNKMGLVAWGYERFWRHKAIAILTGGQFTTDGELKELTASVKPDMSRILVDFTCSTGLYGRTLKHHFPDSRVYFLDLSKAMLKETLSRCRNLSDCYFLRQYAEQPAFHPESVDFIGFGGSWNEVPVPAIVLKEMVRMLKPGGRVFIMGILAAKSVSGRFFQAILRSGGLHFESENQVRELIGQARFQLVNWQDKHPIFLATLEKP